MSADHPTGQTSPSPPADANAILSETRRQLHVCNVCGYCNGYCDVFDAARRRPRLTPGDVEHLAHLCHACHNCLYACQYAPPHLLAVNLPRALADMRQHAYRKRLWPRALAGPVAAHPWLVAVLPGLITGLVVIATLLTTPPEILFARHHGPGAFYAIIPWRLMSTLAAGTLGWALLSIGWGWAGYWRASRPARRSGQQSAHIRATLAALRDLLTLRNLRGGGGGCNDRDGRFSHWRRRWHQTLALGVMLCFAATAVASVYHHVFERPAPYPSLSAPVILGTFGGLAMLLGIGGLLALRRHADPGPRAPLADAASLSLLIILLAIALSGLALLLARATPLMGLLLALHLGTVLAFFAILPFTKMVHAGYRFLALLREAQLRQTLDRPVAHGFFGQRGASPGPERKAR